MRHLRTIFALTLLLTTAASAALAQLTTNYVRMGIALPLKEKSPRGAKMVEFYQGLLLAVDSVKHQGCTVDLVAHHTGSTAEQMDSLLATNPFANCDIVFGPLDAAQLPALADYCNLKNIRLVIPFSPQTIQIEGRPYHYIVNAPRSVVQKEAAWFVKNLFTEDNIVFIECNEHNYEGTAFTERVRVVMDQLGTVVQQVNINATDEELAQSLKRNTKNLIIANSASLDALNKLRERLRSFTMANPGFNISLFGYPAWQTYASQMQTDFFQFDTYIYTTFYRNPESEEVKKLEQSFERNFRWPMQRTYPRYGLLGFDIGYYFLHGLAQFGKHFEANLVATITNPLQNPLRFDRANSNDGYVNSFVFVVHYANYQAVELLYRNQ